MKRGLVGAVLFAGSLVTLSAGAEEASPATRRPEAESSPALMLRAGAGAFYTKIFSVTSYGGEGFVGLGSSGKRFAWDGGVHVARGTTLHGLAITKARVAFSFEWPIGIVRLGLGPSLGYLSMQAATYTDGGARRSDSLRQLSIGTELHASVDLFELAETDAVFLRGSFQAEPGAYGGLLALGYRWVAWGPDEE